EKRKVGWERHNARELAGHQKLGPPPRTTLLVLALDAHDVHLQDLRGGGRPPVVRHRFRRHAAAGRHTGRQNPQGSQGRRHSDRAAQPIRLRRESQDREGHRHRAANVDPAGRERGHRMKRRAFIAGIGGVAAWPLAARAQQAAMPVIGFLNSSPEQFAERIAAFRGGMRRRGFVEGRNVAIEQRWWGSSNDRIPALVADLVDRKVDVIVATGGSAQAALAATSTIPLVLLIPGDPVKSGLVASLGRPGRNATGISMYAFTLGPKRFQWLRETVPNARLMAVLANPTQPDLASKDDVA